MFFFLFIALLSNEALGKPAHMHRLASAYIYKIGVSSIQMVKLENHEYSCTCIIHVHIRFIWQGSLRRACAYRVCIYSSESSLLAYTWAKLPKSHGPYSFN